MTRERSPLTALGHYVVVRADVRPGTTRGGVLLPDNLRGPLPRGEVLSVGIQVDPILGISVGDRVLFVNAAQAHEVSLTEHLFVVHQAAIVARVAPEVPDGVPATLA